MYDVLKTREDYELYSDWVNFALGEEFIDSSQIFDIEKVMEADAPLGSVPLFIGIDFGKTCYIVVGQRDSEGTVIIRHYDMVSEHKIEAFVEDLLRNYFICGMVLDALPQTKLAADIRDLFPGSAYTAYYSDNQKDYFAIKANEEDVTINRTMLFDKVLAIKQLVLNKGPKSGQFKEHLQGMVKQRLKDDIVESERYVKVKPDHFLHALGYMYCAMDIFEESGSHIVLPTVETTTMQQ
jgi:hypothetical protein